MSTILSAQKLTLSGIRGRRQISTTAWDSILRALGNKGTVTDDLTGSAKSQGLRPEDEYCRPEDREQIVLGRLLQKELQAGYPSKLGYCDSRIFRELRQAREELLTLQTRRIESVELVGCETGCEQVKD